MNPPKCPICDSELKQVDPGELSFSHSEEINERGDTIDCWFAEWKCNCGVYAQEWFEDDPPTDFGNGACRSGEWSYWKSSEEYFGFRNRDGTLVVGEDVVPADDQPEYDGEPIQVDDPDDRNHQRQWTCAHCHLPLRDCECSELA